MKHPDVPRVKQGKVLLWAGKVPGFRGSGRCLQNPKRDAFSQVMESVPPTNISAWCLTLPSFPIKKTFHHPHLRTICTRAHLPLPSTEKLPHPDGRPSTSAFICRAPQPGMPRGVEIGLAGNQHQNGSPAPGVWPAQKDRIATGVWSQSTLNPPLERKV